MFTLKLGSWRKSCRSHCWCSPEKCSQLAPMKVDRYTKDHWWLKPLNKPLLLGGQVRPMIIYCCCVEGFIWFFPFQIDDFNWFYHWSFWVQKIHQHRCPKDRFQGSGFIWNQFHGWFYMILPFVILGRIWASCVSTVESPPLQWSMKSLISPQSGFYQWSFWVRNLHHPSNG